MAMRESGPNPNAQNPTSSAYGIAQEQWRRGRLLRLWDDNSTGQIGWMLAYIKARDGDPIRARAHELSGRLV